MTQRRRPTIRKPATKFPNLRKKLAKTQQRDQSRTFKAKHGSR